MSRLVRLFPRSWRDRYADEFQGLLDERAPTPMERFDILRGALDAHLHPQVRSTAAAPPPPIPESDLLVARRLGLAAIVGAVLWPAAMGIALIGPLRYDDQGAYRDGAAAFPFFFLAVGLLAASLLGQVIRLPADARLGRAAAVGAIPFLLLFGLSPWMWPFALAAFGLIGLVAVAGLRAAVWPIWASLAVVGGVLGVVLIAVAAAAFAGTDRMAGGAFFVAAGLVLVPTWLSLGATLIRRPASPPAVGP